MGLGGWIELYMTAVTSKARWPRLTSSHVCSGHVPAGRALFRFAQFCRDLPQLDVVSREPPQLDHDLLGRRRLGLTRRLDLRGLDEFNRRHDMREVHGRRGPAPGTGAPRNCFWLPCHQIYVVRHPTVIERDVQQNKTWRPTTGIRADGGDPHDVAGRQQQSQNFRVVRSGGDPATPAADRSPRLDR